MGWVLLIGIIILGIWTFDDKYDVDITYDNWQSYRTVAREQETLESCQDIAYEFVPQWRSDDGQDYLCMKWSRWSEMTNEYSKYDSKHR